MAKEKEVVEEIAAWLLTQDTYRRDEAQARWPSHPALFGARITKAEDLVRRLHNVEFRPDKNGLRVRATHVQAAHRADRSYAAGLRKIKRAVDKLDVAASMAPPEEREALERRASHRAFQLTAAKSRARKRLDP